MPEKPNPSEVIKFGTDGWRGVIAEDFTFDNVRLVSRAVASYLKTHEDYSKGILIGYDCRFLSDRFARAAAEEVSAHGIPVWLASSYTPTPAVSYGVRNRKAAGAIIITASHNPSAWNGLKFKGAYGGSASPAMVGKIEEQLPRAAETKSEKNIPGTLEITDFNEPYLRHIEQVVNFRLIASRNFRFVADPLHGAARQVLAKLFERNGVNAMEIHGNADPLFGGLHPEPIPPHIKEAQRTVVEKKADAGFATDGDADRVGAIDRTGRFVDSHQIFSILLQYLVEARGLRGRVTKTFSTTKLVDKLAAKYSLPLYETPIGFKYIVDRMLSTDILIGGEESGGIGIPSLGGPERDGILNSVLLSEAMAHYGKSLGELIEGLHQEFGPHYYDRVDLVLRPGQKERAIAEAARPELKQFAGFPVVRREDLDGIKMYLENGTWLLVRPSGTEPLLRVYVEGPTTDLVQEVLTNAEKFIRKL